MAWTPRGVLSFAEDGFFTEQEKKWSWPGAPPKLTKRLHQQTLEIYCIALGTGEDFFAAWKGKDGKQYWWHQLENYPALSDYLADEGRKKKYQFDKFHVALGQNGAFYFNNDGSGQWYQGVDAGLRREIRYRITAQNTWDYDPRHVTLGFGGSYVLVGKKGDIFWDLKGHYGGLDKILQEATVGIKTITLSPFSDKYYYVQFTDGSQKWWIKNGWVVNAYGQ